MTPIKINGSEYYYYNIVCLKYNNPYSTHFYKLSGDKVICTGLKYKFFGKKIYKTEKQYEFCFMYPDNIEDTVDLTAIKKLEQDYQTKLLLKQGLITI